MNQTSPHSSSLLLALATGALLTISGAHAQEAKGLPDYAKQYLEDATQSDGALLEEVKGSRLTAAKLAGAKRSGVPAKGKREIVVNIPEQMLYAFEADGSVGLKSKVIIGKKEKPTPVFQSKITSTKFYPDWTAPLSITLNTLDDRVSRGMLVRESGTSNLWKPIKRSPDGFTARLVDEDGNPIGDQEKEITIRRMMNQAFLFYVPPGTEGPMGLAKFTSKSEYGVFLHGTNKPGLFAQKSRLLSAGCIRVEKMVELVAWVHEKDVSWAEAEAELDPKRYERVSSPVDLSVVYFRETNWAGKKATHPDVYGIAP